MTVKKLNSYLEKKSIRAETIDNYESLKVLGVSNKEGITITDHKKSIDLSKYQLIEEGDFAYNPYRINVGSIGLTPKGVKGLVSPAYVVFKTNKNLLPDLLLDFLKSKDGLFQINKYARGTVRKALRFDDLCLIEMTVFDTIKQKRILKKRDSVKLEIDKIDIELHNQQTLLKKLRQQILQDAIEGKLTKEWREQNLDVEPASELLKRIEAEKQQLIKDKKIKKQKPLPEITDDERPFTLPESWEWCRLVDIMLIHYGKGLTKSQTKPIGKYAVYGSNGIVGYYDKGLTDKRAIIIGRKGSAGAIQVSDIGSWTTDVAYYVEESSELVFEYMIFLLKSLNLDMLGKGVKPGLNRNEAYLLNIPFASYKEQKEIVKKVEKLFAICDQLEAQISSSQTNAEQLMQSVLKEAFSQDSAA